MTRCQENTIRSETLRITELTAGPYINSQNIEVGEDIYFHEYGHTIQSRILGPLYTSKIAVPSGISAFYTYDIQNDYSSGSYHDRSWYEIWANRLAGVNETDDYSREYRHNTPWYFLGVWLLPIFPN